MNSFFERAQERMREKKIVRKKVESKSSVKPNMALLGDDFVLANESVKTSKDGLIEGEGLSTSISIIRAKCVELLAGSRKQQRERVLLVYRYALFLKHNAKAYDIFVRDPCWKDKSLKLVPQPGCSSKALDFLLKVIIDSNNKEDQKQRSLFLRALKKPFQDDRSDREIERLLKEFGGLQGLAKHNADTGNRLSYALETKDDDGKATPKLPSENSLLDNILFDEPAEDNLENDNKTDFDFSDGKDEDDLDFSSIEVDSNSNSKIIKQSGSIYCKLNERDLQMLGSPLKQAWLVLEATNKEHDSMTLSVKLVKIALNDPTKSNN